VISCLRRRLQAIPVISSLFKYNHLTIRGVMSMCAGSHHKVQKYKVQKYKVQIKCGCHSRSESPKSGRKNYDFRCYSAPCVLFLLFLPCVFLFLLISLISSSG
jgi:hypothetical protein